MVKLNLPSYNYKTKNVENKHYIFDSIRKKYIMLSPEEWVRQHFVNFLINHLSYPRGMIQVETALTYNHLPKRLDIAVLNQAGKPLLLIECKAPSVTLKQEHFEQLGIYNKITQAPLVMLTNGLQHYCCYINQQSGEIQYLTAPPTYGEALKYH